MITFVNVMKIGVEGNIYEHYPNFPNRVNEALRDLYGQNVDRINIGVGFYMKGIKKAISHPSSFFRSPVMEMVLEAHWLPCWLEKPKRIKLKLPPLSDLSHYISIFYPTRLSLKIFSPPKFLGKYTRR